MINAKLEIFFYCECALASRTPIKTEFNKKEVKKLKKKNLLKDTLRLISLGFGVGAYLVFGITFYGMLFNQTPHVLISTNNHGEFWFEFIYINIVSLITIIVFIITLKNWVQKNFIEKIS